MTSTKIERDLQGWITVRGSLRSPMRQQNQFTAEGNVRAEKKRQTVSLTPQGMKSMLDPGRQRVVLHSDNSTLNLFLIKVNFSFESVGP